MPPRWRKQPQAAAFGKAIPYVVAGLIALWVITYIVADVALDSRINLPGGPIIFMFAIVLSAFTSAILRYRAWARIRAAEFLCCPVCEYSLRGLPEQARCPECGVEFEREVSREHWRSRFAEEVTTEGILQLTDRHMRQYLRASLALISLAVFLFGLDYALAFTDLRLRVIFGLAPLVILLLQMLLGTRVARRLFWRGECRDVEPR